jgi:penicillin-binding protein 1C
VTVTEALQRSLNAPAVRLLAAVGVSEFLGRLRRLGLSSLDRPAGSYGLPLVLGAGEVSLLELTTAYAALARGGVYLAPRLSLADDSLPARVFSPGACELVTDVLAGVERPDMPRAWDLTLSLPAVAWKTGTSYGHRDAWALGFSARYAIGVWVGNLDGTPVKGISGAHHAGPLLFDLFRALEPGGASLAHHPAPDLTTVEVCAESRELPGPDCPHRIRIPILAGRAPLPRCSLHRRIFVDAGSGERLAGDCLAEHEAVSVVVLVYPPELAAFWRSEGQDVPGLPAPSPLCAAAADGDPPAIVSPSASTPYRLRAAAPAEFQRLRLSARAAPDAGSLTWYEDGRLVAQGPAGENLFLAMTPGRHRLVVLDERGRMAALSYAVED